MYPEKRMVIYPDYRNGNVRLSWRELHQARYYQIEENGRVSAHTLLNRMLFVHSAGSKFRVRPVFQDGTHGNWSNAVDG